MKIGELFLCGYKPDNFTFLREFARQNGLGGIILFSRNFESHSKIRDQIKEFQDICGNDLIVSIDQEGGQVNRIVEQFPVFPSPSYYAKRNDFRGFSIASATTARALRKLGINTNYVPVCDVLTNPDNDLLKQRSFGADPEIVGRFVKEAITACRQNYVLACAKHFPGLGSTAIDPHKQIANTDINQDEFERIHFQPFRQAIADDVAMVMTTHLIAAALDPVNMATFSDKIINDILRRRLGYEGVIITDDLGMGAVSADFSAEERAEKALAAGHDMIMFCHERDNQDSAFQKVLDNLNTGKFSEAFIAAKIARIQKLKEKIPG